MAANSLPPEVRRFIARHIHAVEQLEVLCVLSEKPGRQWSVPDVFREIQSSEKSIAECLENFRAAGLLSSETKGSYRFVQGDNEDTRTVAGLVKAYRERRVSVIECISASLPFS